MASGRTWQAHVQIRRALEAVANRIGFIPARSVNGRVDKAVLEAVAAMVQRFEEDASSIQHASESASTLYAREPYSYASIYAIASGLAGLPLVLRRHLPNGEIEDLNDHPALRILEHPFANTSRYDLIESIVSWLELTGNAYLVTIPSSAGGWAGLWPLPAHLVEIVGEHHGREGPTMAAGYRMPDPSSPGSWLRFKPDELIHFRYWSTSALYGMSFLSPAKRAALGHMRASVWNDNFFQNSARPDVVVSTDQPYNRQADEQLTQWYENKFRGINNAHRFGIGWSGLKFQVLSGLPKDMDWKNLTGTQKAEILAAAGVPPFKVSDLEHASWANSREQNVGFFRDTLMPKGRKISAALSRAMHRDWEGLDDAFLEFDFSGVEALQEDQNAKHDRLRADYLAGAITLDEFRQQTGRDPLPRNGGQVLFIPAGGFVTPVGEIAPAAPARSSAAARLVSVQDGAGQHGVKRLPIVEAGLDNAEILRRSILWRQFDSLIQTPQERIANFYRVLLRDQANEIVDRLEALGFREDRIGQVLDFLDSEQVIAAAAHGVRPILSDAGMAGAARASRQVDVLLRRSAKQDMPPALEALLFAAVDRWAETRAAELVTQTNAATKRIIRRTLVQGFADGLSETALAEAVRVRLASEQFMGPRTLTIARTESAGAFNLGTFVNYKENEAVSQKEWLSSRDVAVRDLIEDDASHRIDGQRRDVGKPFDVPLAIGGVARLQYPGDQSAGTPAATINCRCTTIPVIAGGLT